MRYVANLSFLLLLTSGCYWDGTRELKVKSDGASAAEGGADSAVNGGLEGGASQSGGNRDEAGASGSDGSSGQRDGGNGGDGGDGSGNKSCTRVCDTQAASRCVPTLDQCAPCATSNECKAFAAEPACQSGVGCFACTSEDLGACAATATPHCKTDGNTCVECNATADCTLDPKRPVCEGDTCRGCKRDVECTGSNKVCDEDSGQCVQCDKNERKACGSNVCNVLTKTCTNKAEFSSPACDECVADDQCAAGHLCRPMTFGPTSVGFFCLPKKQVGTPCARPYSLFVSTGVSIEADEADVCSLYAGTSCAAHRDYRNKVCGVDASGTPVAMNALSPDSSLCGKDGVDDGLCAAFGAPGDGQYRCTVACNNSADDCPDASGVSCNTAPSPDQCTF